MVAYLRAEMEKVADPGKAAPMQAYMKTDQPFYGIQAGPRRDIFKEATRLFNVESRDEYEAIVLDLWEGVHREEMYQALEVVERYKAFRDPQSWPLYDHLVRTSPSWDTLDWIAGKIIGTLVLQHRELEQELIRWRTDPNFWVRRASLLAHLRHKERTNTDLMAETIVLLSHEKEFFIRKAIGWVLRTYARVDPGWVRTFVAQHQHDLSGLSKREALKHIGP